MKSKIKDMPLETHVQVRPSDMDFTQETINGAANFQNQYSAEYCVRIRRKDDLHFEVLNWVGHTSVNGKILIME